MGNFPKNTHGQSKSCRKKLERHENFKVNPREREISVGWDTV